MPRAELPIRDVDVRVLEVPTDAPESDGTFAWGSTTMVVVHVTAGDVVGLGYTYGNDVIATLIDGQYASLLTGADAFDVRGRWLDLYDASRNLGRRGLASYAISALDIALWDAKARALDLPLAALLGAARPTVPIYGSGGFTSYDDDQLARQLTGSRRASRASR